MKKRNAYIIIVILFLIAFSFIIWRKSFENRIYVKSQLVEKENIEKYINLIGEVASNNVKNYYLNDGKVRDIKVQVGQKVSKDEVLATSSGGNTLSESEGIVTKVDKGGLSFGTNLNPTIVVQDINDLKVIVDVNKNDDREIKIGQSAVITDNNGEGVSGEVIFRSPVAEKSKSITDNESYVKIEIKILEESDNFTIGFNNEVNILVGEIKDIVAIPIEAIENEKGNINYVYVLKDNSLEKREVTLGLEGDLRVQVISGVTEGEEVILNPTSNLSNIKKVYRWEK